MHATQHANLYEGARVTQWQPRNMRQVLMTQQPPPRTQLATTVLAGASLAA